MRNTLRFLLGNLHGFTPADALPVEQLVELDRWAIARTAELHGEITAAYEHYQLHLIYQKVHNFCVVDLGGLYLDVIKDRLYTTPAGSLARRSAQTALWHIAEAMVRWLAPVLSFTAEETWAHLPGTRPESVFLSTWHTLPDTGTVAIDWPALLALRTAVGRELEQLRGAGHIGAPLDAEVDIHCSGSQYATLNALGDELRFLLITSAARVHAADAAPAGAMPAAGLEGVWLVVKKSEAAKCVRCWHHRPDVGQLPAHPELCGRCVTNIEGPGESRRYA
jgi:isoleucyl-tRNA synthetase